MVNGTSCPSMKIFTDFPSADSLPKIFFAAFSVSATSDLTETGFLFPFNTGKVKIEKNSGSTNADCK